MSGHFHKIIGKTISGVYCRENERIPKGQVFITFDDGTYFEMYTMSDEIKGIKGLSPGDLDHVIGLNHPEGKELCRYPASQDIMMWVPPLQSNPEKQIAMGVPSDVKVTSDGDYWVMLVDHVQNLINQLPTNEAQELIEHYLIKGTEITRQSDPLFWGEHVLLTDDAMSIICDVEGLDFGSISDSNQHGNMMIKKEDISLENVLKAIQVKFRV